MRGGGAQGLQHEALAGQRERERGQRGGGASAPPRVAATDHGWAREPSTGRPDAAPVSGAHLVRSRSDWGCFSKTEGHELPPELSLASDAGAGAPGASAAPEAADMGFLGMCGGGGVGADNQGRSSLGALIGGQKAVTAGHAGHSGGANAQYSPAKRRTGEIGSVAGTKDEDTVAATLTLKVPMFARLQPAAQRQVVETVYIRSVPAGELLIVEDEEGEAADEMYIVKKGEFEVLERRHGVSVRVNTKGPGECFGEVALFMRTKRSATVAAVTQAEVFVVERAAFRRNLRKAVQADTSELELFLNSVPLLKNLTSRERLRLVDAMEEKQFRAGDVVVREGQMGDAFYIVKSGEATVTIDDGQAQKTVNQLFRADFFGERALLKDEPRNATVRAVSDILEVLVLHRCVFDEVLGPLQAIMEREKSSENIKQRLVELEKGAQLEVDVDNLARIRLLGFGAFSAVFLVRERSTKREYALKRMRKNDVAHCSDHVFCEQRITRTLQHPFIMRQYATFHDESYLYFVFDYVDCGDLMDALILVAEVRQTPRKWHECVKSNRKDDGVLMGMNDDTAKFYVASLVLALEFIHSQGIVYRDLKPENVMLDSNGYIKLADFGFAKELNSEDGRTYTFCGTPGYVAPENILANGYNTSVDWWSLGVLSYVLLTGQQPFGRPSEDAMAIMRRIINPSWEVNFPSYLSKNAVSFISGLLQRKPSQRLGHSALGVAGIKAHPWFHNFPWEQLRSRKLAPPLEPSRLKKDKSRISGWVDDPAPPHPTPEARRAFANF